MVLGLVLLIAAQGAQYVRDQLRTSRTWELLARLDEALTAYHQAAGAWPPGVGAEAAGSTGGGSRASRDNADARPAGDLPARTLEPRATRDAAAVVQALLLVPAARTVMDAIPEPLRAGAVLQSAAGGQPAASRPAWSEMVDAWGAPLRCLTARGDSAADRQAVAANGGKPVFVSAGPDGEFGTENSPAVSDNLRSDELPSQ